MSGDINFGGDNKIYWGRNTDSASISFKNDGDGDANSYMSFVTSDNGNEYFRWSHSSGSTNTEWMALRSDGLRVRGTKVSLEGHSHNDLYYTKVESNAKYITDIATSVNKLTFTRNGSNIARNITVNVVYSQGNLTDISNKDNTTKASSGLYIYNSYNQVIGTNSYSSVLSINTGGTIQIAGNWGDDQTRNLYWRSQSDRNVADYPWKSWRTILDSENYSSTLDSRYYTESEVNSLLSKKLNTSDFNWTNLSGKLVVGNEFNIVNAGFNAEMYFNYLPINNRNSTATVRGYHFGNGAKGYASVQASGFIKTGSNSSYVLLGDGGHKLEGALNVANADMVDGYHENSFLRYRGATYTDQEATLWSQIGIKQYNNVLPDNLTGVYNYGSVISLPGFNSRFEIYASHQSSNGNGLYYRSGWGSDKKAWLKFIDSSNIGSQSVNYANSAGHANSAGNADTLGGIPRNYGQAPFGTIPSIGNDGVMEVGRYIDFHNDNNGKHDFSTRLQSTGNYENEVNLPSASGTLALTSNIPNPTNYYWANVKISASSSTTTSPAFSNVYLGNSLHLNNRGSNSIYNGPNDSANGVGGPLNNLVFSSWYGVSFTTSCAGLTYTNKNAVSINCRTGQLYARQVQANGFMHTGHNNNDAVLLAGGDYKTLNSIWGGDSTHFVFLGYLTLHNGVDGTISDSFMCLGKSVPFTYTRGGAYCLINIPNTSFQTFYIKAAIASVHYSGAGMGHLVGNHRGDGAWWLHCDAVGSNAVQVKGFHLANENNDSWWGGNPLYSSDGAAKIITVCLFGYVKFR